MQGMLRDKRGVIPFLGFLIAGAIGLVILVALLFTLTVTLPKLIGFALIIMGLIVTYNMTRAGEVSQTSFGLIIFLIGFGFVLVFVPQIQGLFGNLQALTMVDLLR